MHTKEAFFISLFVIALSLTLYFLGGSVTGLVVQTMYCEGDCQEFCKFNTDCAPNQVCCDKSGFGVCMASSDCDKQYEYVIDIPDFESVKTPNLEKPAATPNVPLFTFLSLVLIAIGIIYYVSKHKHLDSKIKKKRSKKKKSKK